MAVLNPQSYWNRNPSGIDGFTTHYERVRYNSAIDWAQKIIAYNNGSLSMSLDPKTFFTLKQEQASDSLNIARFSGDPEEQELQRASYGILTPEEQSLMSQVSNEASKAVLQMYYDAYMAPVKSDIEYRLGNVQGIYLRTNGTMNPDYGLVNSRGQMYTRTNFATSFAIKYYNGSTQSIQSIGESDAQGRIIDPRNGYFYTNLLFPPYKFGPKSSLSYSVTPNGWTTEYYKYYTTDPVTGKQITHQTSIPYFDPQKFLVYREGFNYREPAFKAINDNISFLQYLLEKSCGIVSTYLTEWDISLYLQEAMLTKFETLPSKIWLLYRIQEDNPLATNDGLADATRGYDFRDFKAYSFGVTNAAVSKLFGSNQKKWRPSDYPLSTFWAPYTTGIHTNIIWTDVEGLTADDTERIPYLDFWDKAANDNFDYENKLVNGEQIARTTKEKIEQVDFVQATQAAWADFDLIYYQALYTSPDDSLSDADTAFTLARQNKKYVSEMVKANKNLMLVNGGASSGAGGSTAAGSFSPNKAKLIKRIFVDGDLSGDDPSSATSQLQQAQHEAGGQKLSDLLGGPTATTSDGKLQGNKVQDSSKMSKDTGIAYSPCLYGGPHGSYFSPNSTQSYFDKNTIFLRDIPRANPLTDWSSLNRSQYRQGNDSHYYNGLYGDQSPNEAMHNAKQGFQSYVTAYAMAWVSTTKVFYGELKYDRGHGRCLTVSLPSSCEGYPIHYDYEEVQVFSYNGLSNMTNKTATVYRRQRIWYEIVTIETRDPNLIKAATRRGWWNSYYNDYVTGKHLGGGLYAISFRQPRCIGTYWHWIWRSYRKLLLHDEPNMSWNIRPYQWYWYAGGVNTFRRALGRAAAKFGGFRWTWAYKEPYVYNVGFRLICPGNSYQGSESQYQLIIKDDIYGITSYTLSGNESAVLHKMVRIPGTSASGADLIFCYGPSYEDVHMMFSVRVYSIIFPMWYWKRHERTYSSRRKRVWYTLEHVWAVSLMVDMWNPPRFFASDIHNDSLAYTNRLVGRYNPANASFEPNHLFSFPGKVGGSGTTTASRRRLNDPLELMADPNYLYKSPGVINEIRSSWPSTHWFSQSFAWGFFTFFSYGGITGTGILSSIQGFSPNTDAMKSDFEDPSQWVPIPGASSSTAFGSYNYVCHQVSYNPAAATVDVDGTRWFALAAAVQWKATSMPSRIRNSLKRWITTATFYKSDMTDENNMDVADMINTVPWSSQQAMLGHPYLVKHDTSVRVFYSQIIFQRSFLEVSRNMFIEQIDFQNVRKLLNNCIDKVVLNSTNPRITGYSYWIQKAVSIFGGTNDELTTNKNKLIAQVNGNIAAFDTAIAVLQPLIRKDIMNWTFDEWGTAMSQMLSIKAQNDTSTYLSDYYMSYLNVLYEMRKYYICKRYNKEDGTMWVMRALESLLPWTNDPITPNQRMPTVAELGAPGAANGEAHNVAFYELQNNLDVKADALRTGKILPEDAIKVVYVKVKWATIDDYNAWLLYKRYPTQENEAKEVVEIKKPLYKKITFDGADGKKMSTQIQVGVEPRYAFKPQDNTYTLISLEWEKSEKDRLWNESHADEIASKVRTAKIVKESDTTSWWITWKDDLSHTPIVYDIFSNIDVSRLIEYSKKSVSAQELLCFSKQDADFWRVHVMGSKDAFNDRPRKKGHLSKLRLKHYGTESTEGSYSMAGDINFSIAGALGYSIWPIIEKMENPIMGDVPNLIDAIESAYGIQIKEV